ncbi:MAG: HBL/NHE enterotoxin family protein [Microcystis aeruginosa LL13-06]|nr:HBL/NHE enterotoxin family protein [Microcystis aeruginosa LL13-06]
MTDFFSLLDVSSLYPKLAEYHIENLVPDLLVLQKSCQTILMQPDLSVGQSGTVSTDIVSTQQEWKVNARYVKDEVTRETISLLTQIKAIIGLMDSIAKTAKVAPTKATLVAALNYLVSQTEKCQEALNSFSNFVEAQAKERETKQAELSKEVTEHLQSLQSSQGEIEELRNKIRAVNSRIHQLIKTIVSDGARVGEMIGEIFKPVVELISKLPSGGKASQETKALSIMEFQAKADTVGANQNFENITSIEEGNEELRRLYNRLASLNMLVTKLTIVQEQASAYSGSLSSFAGYVTGTKTKIDELLCGLKELREDLNNDNESSVPTHVEMKLNKVNHKWQEIGATIALHQQTLSGVN